MSEVKRVKIQNFIETQIPEFLNVDNPLFKDFLNQYYVSLEHQTGSVDLSNNLNFYKNIENFNYETFITESIPHTLIGDLEPFHTTITVNHTIGFPEKYGLLKIDDEIITYTSKTETTFDGCIRGFSGLNSSDGPNKDFNFSSTNAEFHENNSTIENLSVRFFKELFKKFRYQFVPGFENRDFYVDINLQNVLSRAKDFYSSKGTDISFKILFKVLFGEDVEIIKPRDYMLRPSDNTYFITKNILVEKVLGTLDPLSLSGYTLYQDTPDGLASAAIYNVEVRPVDNNKILYEISLDPSSFNLNFISTKTTKVLEDTLSGSSNLIVDNTVGFSTTSLLVNSKNSPSPFYISYQEKTINQFLGVDNILVDLSVGDVIMENKFSYVNIDSDYAYFRILNIIDSVDYSKTFGMRDEDKLSLSSFGADLNDNVYFTNWIYNIPTKHKIKSITSTSQVNRKRIELYDSVKFTKDEIVSVYNSNTSSVSNIEATVELIVNTNTIEIESTEDISSIDTIQKIVTKCNVTNYPDANSLVSNVQNTYTNYNEENLYVASSGLPDYQIFANDRKILISTPNNPNPTSGIGHTTILNTNIEHRFYTGEKVWVDSSTNLGIETGSYYVTTIGNYPNSNKISLSYSNSDIFSKKYVQVAYASTGELVKEDYQYKTLEHQKLLKKFPIDDQDYVFDEDIEKRSTNNKPVGMLVNGVEIYSPTLYDENIYYGKLDDIKITSPGSGYDLINTPNVNIVDKIDEVEYGIGAKAHIILEGNLKEVKIINPGSGYDENLKISVSGGNGNGALLEPNIIKDRIVSGFRGDGVGVNPTDNSITFVSPHNFEDGEIIEYFPNSNLELEYSDPIIQLVGGVENIIGGQIRKLSENSFYFVGKINDKTIKLYRTREDAADKINEINLTTSPSSGFHYFKSIVSRNKLIGVSVKNSGVGYSNKKVIIPSVNEDYGKQNGINIEDNYIFARSHNFNDKDLLIYSTTGSPISGLSTSTKYYVKILDENRFRLSIAGTDTNISSNNYYAGKYVRLNSLGVGTHTFSYPPIELTIEASLESSNGNLILPQLEPVFTGSVQSIFIENYGEKYGTPNIINFHRRPNIELGDVSSEAIFKPLISNGTIIDVQILNYGVGYGKDIDLIISGKGNFADLYPVVENGRIVSVNIINGGIGYDESTTITVRSRGSGAKFLVDVFEWKINQVEKNKYLLQNTDEGILVPSKNQQDGLQFVHFYPPKILRSKLEDNLNSSNQEITTKISPILGWSYDGFPIYGPYSIIDGAIQRVKSSYTKNIESNSNLRPTGNMIPDGFFIQDYTYDPLNGDLDQYNGRFIKNEDFPDGTYAYFFTIDIDSTNNSIPQYPYVVSSEFKNHYLEENYTPSFNQNINFDSLDLIRNTSPYYLNSQTSEYGLIDRVQSKYNQDFIVKSTSSSGIDSVFVYDSGDEYKVGDILDFGKVSAGSGVYATVSSIEGKSIEDFSVGVSTEYNVSFSKVGNKIVGTARTYLSLLNNDIVIIENISSNLYKFIEGTKKVTLASKVVGLSTDIPSIGVTGDLTTIYLSDILGFEVDDFIKIDSEIFKVLQIIPENSSLFVLRSENPGIHTVGLSSAYLLPRKFAFFDNSSTLTIQDNKTCYFNPENVVSIGNSTLAYTKEDSSIISIPQKSIYIPNHSYKTGQPLKYNVGIGGTGLYVYDDITPTFQLENNQVVYAVNLGKDFLGISTVGFSSLPNGIGNSSYSLYFSSPTTGIGLAHSLTTQYTEVFGKVENYFINISTKESHNLISGDSIELSIQPEIQESIKFRYDSTIRKITTEKITFDSSIVNPSSFEIDIDTRTLKTGDKIVYYSEGNTGLGGLQDEGVYFVVVSNPGKIKLSEYYEDALDDNVIGISTSSGTHSIAKINPKISITNGNYVLFDMSDSSLTNIRLKLFKDKNFNRELETYDYVLSSGQRYLATGTKSYPKELYYSFDKLNQILYPDNEVIDYNMIKIVETQYVKKYPINKIDDFRFKLNLTGKPERTDYSNDNLTNLYYTTSSTNTNGPIHKIKVNSFGQGYKKIPRVTKINSISGNGAIISAKSNKIGRISKLERVKDGFDYPTDITLIPNLSVPAIIQVEGISRVDYVGIITGGNNYNTKPTLKVIGNDSLILDPIIEGTSVVDVNIISNVNNLTKPLRIIPTRNSNGYSINDITVSGNDVTLELLNSDNQIYPLITTGYGSTEVIFPFSEGDEIFIERCRISLDEVDDSGNIIVKNNYNSADYDYRFFTVTGINTTNYTVTYSMAGITTNLGNYLPDFGYGYVVNRKDMAEFEMVLANDLKYVSGERVLGYSQSGTNTFSARVMENGWDNEINQLRVTDVKGSLEAGDKLDGTVSLLSGVVRDINIFNFRTKVGVSRDKLNDLGDRIGFLNDFQQRISDNDYYQKFSYSIQGKVPYDKWKEPIRSIIHPSGFKEFSDLTVVGGSTASMKVGTAASLDLTVNIDNYQSLYTKNNFAMVTEEDQFEDGSIERVLFEEGVALRPYILSKSNKVTSIDDISQQFTGTSDLQIIANKDVTFISTDLYKLGVSTSGLNLGDKLGFSTYHFYPDSTYILSIGEGYIGISSDTPHRLYSVNGISTSVTENLNFYRKIPGGVTVGISTFKLKHNNYPLFYREFDASNGVTTTVNLSSNSFSIPEHNFHTGQKLLYTPKYNSYSAVASTSVGSGAILEPIFVGLANTVSKINVINGGSGYSSINKPKIEIVGTKTPLLEGIFDPLVDPVSGIITSIVVVDPGYGYFLDSPGEIGITTTPESEGRKDIIMAVGGGIGSAIYENGYNVAISGISGISSSVTPDFSGSQNIFWGFNEPFIPMHSTTGSGTDARFSVFIVYSSTTGTPISTSVILRDGGRGYSIGDTVSIAGTYIGGSTPENNLSFTVSKVSSTRIASEANSTYSNILGNSSVGYGTGAIFNISRDSLGDIETVDILFGGSNYELTDNITIAGTYIGGSSPGDNLYLSPTILGTDKLPSTVYVEKIDVNNFKLSGLSTSPILELTSLGVGTHSFLSENPNANSIISIDNVTQTPIYPKNIELQLADNVSYNDTVIYVNSGISSVILNDILIINDEYMFVKNVSIAGTNDIIVDRGILGTNKSVHSVGDKVFISNGNYNIVKDTIHFASPPYGPNGLPGLEINSSFSGRVFSRRSDPFLPNNESIIFDDISDQFTGIAATEFILKSNQTDVVGIFTNANSISGSSSGTDINNNPIILVNNIPQIGGTDYVIDTPGQNTIKFLSGVPLAGKITDVGLTTGLGYLPLVGASATVSVSVAGTISNIFLTGFGKGYREPPLVTIASTVGSGASIISSIGVGGTVVSLEVVNPGTGYTSDILPEVRVDLPQNYYSLPLEYATGYSGIGTGAKISVIVGNGSSIISFNLDDPGRAYKVGDVLVAPGISTDPNASKFEEFKITVLETYTDKFAGWYPGQFIQFDDISQYFNGSKKRFTLTVTIEGNTEVLSLKAVQGISLTDNLFVFINDILQVPGESYTFSGTRISFKEAPKVNSKCTILFFKGSDLDVEQVDPVPTLKEGDTIQIDENIFDEFDRPQFDRVIKDIFAVDVLDTFTYDSLGISTDSTKIRPLNWTKQTQDRVINGVLYPKSRPGLKSKIIPTAKIIKDVSLTDQEIYIDSAIPLFSDLDESRGIGEELRDIVILDNKTIESPLVNTIVSSNGTISDIEILDQGVGYIDLQNPDVSISKSFIERLDPIYNWKGNVGVSTDYTINSIGYGTGFIAVGQSGLNYLSYDGYNWTSGFGTSNTDNLNYTIGYGNTYFVVGDNANVYSTNELDSTKIWKKIDLLKKTQLSLLTEVINPSDYTGNFSGITYRDIDDTIVLVGTGGKIFSSSGINTNSLYERKGVVALDLQAVTSNSSYFVAVGNLGSIFYSTNGISWSGIPIKITQQTLNDIIWNGQKFVVVGNGPTIGISTNGLNWNLVPNSGLGLNTNLIKINYNDNLYTVLDSTGKLYFSVDLNHWEERQVTSENLLDIISIGSNENEKYILSGESGFLSVSEPFFNEAIAISTTNNGTLTGITIVNDGFGYSIENTIPTIIECESAISEKLYSIKAKGDYGVITDLNVYDTGNVGLFGTTLPAIEFTLKSSNFPVNLPTMEYTPLEVGDYFIISNSNVICGHALTGISTSLGGLSNYPNSKVGTANTYIDGIYKVEATTSPVLGISTVRCHFVPIPAIGPDKIEVNIGSNTTGFYGDYSFGVIYDYQNRARESPKSFIVNKDDGLVGLDSGPMIYRTRGVI